MTTLELKLGGTEATVAVETVIIAGWTGRDRAAVEQHIAELEELGVPRPSTAPVFYRASASRLTTATEIESTAASSGEVEAVLLRHAGELWVGVGSDHTDREVETYGVAISKQLCDKPLARELWPYDELADHWDQLRLRSWIGSDQVLYQDGALRELMHPEELMALAEPAVCDGTLMFCGTFTAIGGIRSSEAFRYELTDPVLERSLLSAYAMRELPLVS
jgi:hypothetical protein